MQSALWSCGSCGNGIPRVTHMSRIIDGRTAVVPVDPLAVHRDKLILCIDDKAVSERYSTRAALTYLCPRQRVPDLELRLYLDRHRDLPFRLLNLFRSSHLAT